MELPLSGKRANGRVALVDADDYRWARLYRWHLTGAAGYVAASVAGDLIYLHRRIMGEPSGEVDHINRDPLDNRKANLRVCTREQNGSNRGKPAGNYTSPYKGVAYRPWQRVRGKWYADRKPWKAKIKAAGKQFHIGSFETEAEAADAYNREAIRRHGEFAALNDIKG